MDGPLKNRKPRVVIDARMVCAVPHGFSRYVSALVRGLTMLAEGPGLPYEVALLVSPESSPLLPDHLEKLLIQAPFLSPKEWFEIPRALLHQAAALYHSPTFSSLPRCPCPWVVTVHDLNHRRYGGLKEKLYYATLLKRFARKASQLVTVSEFSRRELELWLGPRVSSPIEVAYNAIDGSFARKLDPAQTRDALARHRLKEGEFYLCLSNPKPHKNVARLVQAYDAYRREGGRDHPLVLSMREHDQLPGVRAVGGLTESDARALMGAARAVFFPSLYEGFGLPPVEAAALGTSVVVSRIPPHLEGLVDLEHGEALWVEAKDTAGWTAAFHRAERGEVPAVSAKTSQRILDRFSAEALAATMDRIYRHVLGISS